MKTSVLLPNSARSVTMTATDDRLFSGIWLRWHQLTQSEKVVCGCILGIPLWWLWGWSYLFILLVASLLAYEWRQQGRIRLPFPSLAVVALMGFSLYDLLTTYFYGAYQGLSSLSLRDLIGTFDSEFCPAIVIWYIQSRNIRVRLKVVAWAFSVVVALMAIGCLYVVLVKHQASHNPARTIFGALTKKPLLYQPEHGKHNYLLFYRAEDSSLPGLVRFSYFFRGPEALAIVMSFICLLAMDVRHKSWQTWFFVVSCFLLLTSGTRSTWIVLPLALLVRFCLTTGQRQGIWVVLALMATTSFTTLMIPPITHQLLSVTQKTSSSVDQYRADSTDLRSKIYHQTIDRLLTATNRRFLLGHIVPGEPVTINYEPAKIGTHSFYLGSLLYQKGVVGFCIFATYWFSLFAWLYQTRRDRPFCVFLIWLQLTFLFSVMAFEPTVMPTLLIGITLKIPARSTQPWTKYLSGASRIPQPLLPGEKGS